MRCLYLVCYDIASPKRLRKVHRCIKSYAIGGQKSFYECWLTASEQQSLKEDLFALLNEAEDRVHFFQLDPRLEPLFFGKASRQSFHPFMIV